jgi:hypothetical protein
VKPSDTNLTRSGVVRAPYEPPRLTELGTLHEVTLGCDKTSGGSDGFTYHGAPIVCASA